MSAGKKTCFRKINLGAPGRVHSGESLDRGRAVCEEPWRGPTVTVAIDEGGGCHILKEGVNVRCCERSMDRIG